MSKSLIIVGLVCVSGLAAAGLSEKFAKRLEAVDATYQQAVLKADNTRFYAVQKASQERIRALKSALSDATKSGDFDAATEIKARVTAAESADAIEPKPKTLTKFGGHEYAYIDKKATWYMAKMHCERMGGHLVFVESPQELAFLDRMTEGGSTFWLGASDHEKDDTYLFLNGQPVNLG
ncbi:MAG: C-type lectin domain family 4 er E-like, partial [Planctomycetaceae bacterium]|nr:C-type lectin domain family 4 er E-like [Planctomycetaceae bacterium]